MKFHKHIVLKHFFEKLWWCLLCLWRLGGGDSQTFFKRLGPPLAIPKTFERILGPKIGFVHGTYRPKLQVCLCKASLAHPS